MKRIIKSTILLTALCAAAAAQLPKYVLPNRPNFGSNVSVHDPSIFKDGNTYYTFGSHFASSSSANLMSWTQVTSDNSGANTQFGQNNAWRSVLSAGLAHVEAAGNSCGSIWAPDVEKFGDKYYMYYSLSTWGVNRSYIGRVEASNVRGPYSNTVEIVKTSASGDPNAIDPELFYDKNGGLWMVYGSFFAGMYIIELENSGSRIGLPKAGQGIGTRIWAGAGNNGPEGPFIFYNPDTDYYYMMVSFGSLSDSYNMRVARSRNPNGPYTDGRNANLGTVNSSTSASSGMKLAGNYRFDGASRGYAALGHNSVLVDNGKYFVVYHTRFQVGTGNDVTVNHNQYVNQLFFNSDGWPIMAPNRYAGETAGRVEAADFNGDYDVVIHSAVNNSIAFQNSALYTFAADGAVRQGNTSRGSWSRVDGSDYHFTVTINDVAYNGVAVPQWNNDRNYAELSFTGISQAGVSIWANRKQGTWVAPPTSTVNKSAPSKYMMNIVNMNNGTFRVNYVMRDRGAVRIDLYDVKGKMIRTIVNTSKDTGSYQTSFTMTGLAAGMYVVKLTTGNQTLQERVMAAR